jgi:hypothetical protein
LLSSHFQNCDFESGNEEHSLPECNAIIIWNEP